jgi:hypothetical protein
MRLGSEFRQYLEANDAQTLSEYLRNKQAQDPTFYYAVEVDRETSHITIFFGQMVSLSWITNASVMLCPLTPHFKQISLKCLLLQFLAPTITSKQ